MKEGDPVARLEKIKAMTTAIKRSPSPAVQYLTQVLLMPHLPMLVCREMVRGALSTHTLVSAGGALLPIAPVAGSYVAI